MPFEHLNPVQLWHLEIEQDNVGNNATVAEHLKCLPTIVRNHNRRRYPMFGWPRERLGLTRVVFG